LIWIVFDGAVVTYIADVVFVIIYLTWIVVDGAVVCTIEYPVVIVVNIGIVSDAIIIGVFPFVWVIGECIKNKSPSGVVLVFTRVPLVRPAVTVGVYRR